MRDVALCLLVLSAIPPLRGQTLLPAGLGLTLRLENALDSERNRVGDPVVATVLKNVKSQGQIVIPARATVHGHIEVLDRQKNQVAVGLEFNELRTTTGSTRVWLRLERVVSEFPGTRSVGTYSRGRWSKVQISPLPVTILNEPPGVGTLIVPAGKVRHAGLEMIWQTIAPE